MSELKTKDTLVTTGREVAIALYSKDGGLNPIVEEIKTQVAEFAPDATNEKGRKAIASMAMKVARSKTYLDSLGKELTSDWATKKKAVDANRKSMRDELDQLKDDVRKPLTDFENQESERLSKIKELLDQWSFDEEMHGHDVAALLGILQVSHNTKICNKEYQEFYLEALKRKSEYELMLGGVIAKKEADQRAIDEAKAAHERGIAEKAATDAKKNAAKQVADAIALVAKANQDAAKAKEQAINAVAKAKQDAINDAAKAKQDAKDAEARRIADVERTKKESAQALAKKELPEKQAQTKRYYNVNHKKKVNNKALFDLVDCGASEELAKKIVIAIASGKVANVKISY